MSIKLKFLEHEKSFYISHILGKNYSENTFTYFRPHIYLTNSFSAVWN